jgi:hypothetical protein
MYIGIKTKLVLWLYVVEYEVRSLVFYLFADKDKHIIVKQSLISAFIMF